MLEQHGSLNSPNRPEDRFLTELIAVRRQPPGGEPWSWSDQARNTRPGQLLHALLEGIAFPPDAAQWWERAIRAPLLIRFPAADRYALQWLCDGAGVNQQVEAIATQHRLQLQEVQPLFLLAIWVGCNPTPDAAERLTAIITPALERIAGDQADPDDHGSLLGPGCCLGQLTVTCAIGPEPAAQVLQQVLELYRAREATQAQRLDLALRPLIYNLATSLTECGALPSAAADYLFLAFFTGPHQLQPKLREQINQAVHRLMLRVLAGTAIVVPWRRSVSMAATRASTTSWPPARGWRGAPGRS